jgi:hypothetical protein
VLLCGSHYCEHLFTVEFNWTTAGADCVGRGAASLTKEFTVSDNSGEVNATKFSSHMVVKYSGSCMVSCL